LKGLEAVRANEVGTSPLRAQSNIVGARFRGITPSYKNRDDLLD